jgi:polysaccharide biosynthesis protein PslH
MRILFLSRWFPFPTDNGSKLRIANLLRGLSQYHEITLISFSDHPARDAVNSEVSSISNRSLVIPWKPYDPASFNALIGILKPAPRFILDTYSKDMANAISQAIIDDKIEVVIASQLSMASYAPNFQGLPVIFEEIELGVPYEASRQTAPFPQRLRSNLTWYKQRVYLAKLLNYFQACTVVSEREQILFAKSFPSYPNVHVVPNCINITDYEHVREEPVPESLIFTGSFRYSANYDAMVWFIESVFPRIRSAFPGARLTITGDHADKTLPSYENITLTGFVDDIMPLVARSWCSIAPLRVGGGTRLKILEAMALETPVIATSKGAEGLDLENGKHLLIADTPEEFSDYVIKIFRDKDLRDDLAGNAYEAVKEKYDWAHVMFHFLQLVENITQHKNQA